MNPLGIAVIGAGGIGRRHIELIGQSDACQLAAICDANPAAVATARAVGVPFYEAVETLLQRETLDGVIIATSTNHHASVGIQCAELGIPMLVEKPITGTMADAEAFLRVATRTGAPLLVGHHRRHNPLIQHARAIIQGGKLGKLVGFSMQWALLKPDDYYDVAWRTQPGGGPILINLIHDIDNLRYLCGEISSVYAATSSATRNLAVADTASITVQLAGGALGTIFVSDAVPSPWSYELTSGENRVYPHYGEDCYHFYGTAGSLAFPSMRLWRYPRGAATGWFQPLDEVSHTVARMDPLVAQLAHFCCVIRRQEQPMIDGPDGLRTLAATLAIMESATQNAPAQL